MKNLGPTPPYLEGQELEGWIVEPWAMRGSSRARFFQNILVRFCPDLINPLLASAKVGFNHSNFEFNPSHRLN